MTNFNTTKRALFSSVIALLICFTMLLGTTFAWFTDSVTSSGNIIQSGTLNVQLLMDADVNGTYDDISDSTSPIFSADTIWEPGRTQVAYLAIKNNGSLDLKYTVGLNVQNVSKDLYEVMEYAIVPDADANNKVTAWNGGEGVAVGTQSVLEDKTLESGDTYYFALVIHMDELAGDEYQGGEISFNLTVVATQLASESDSFGNQYDADAKYPVVSTVTVPENNTEDVVLSTETVKVVVPSATAQAGDDYKIAVSNETTETDATTGETTVAFDLTMYKNNEKVSGTTVYAITKNVGAGLFINEVTHNGNALTKATTGADQTWTYDAATGELTIYTASFSPFTVSYNAYKDYTITLNRGHNKNSVISVSTGNDSLDIVAVNPSIAGYSVYDGENRIANAVTFRFSNVAEQTISENSYKVSFDLAVLDENGNELTIKEGKYNPYINTDLREYLWVYVNLLGAFPGGYSVSGVNVNGTALTASTGDYAPTGGYLIGTDGIYLQTTTAGTFEIILTK